MSMGQPGQTSLGERLRSIEAEIAAGQAESALAHCQELFAQYPRALAVQRVLGETYLALHKPREALGALDRALAGNPEDARACCARAVIHQMHGDPVAALAWYRRACDVRPDDQALRATYREMATRLGKPPYQPTRLGLARLYVRGSLFPHAIREWETLIAENGDLLEAQVGLVETLWRAERTQEAEEWARRVLMNAPACVKALLIVGVIARQTERAAEAERFLQRAAELDPDHRIAHALFADRAMGDKELRALFWGDEPVSASPSARLSSGPRRQTSQPAFATQTNATLTGAPSLADLSAALSRPLPTGRPQQLPPEFHSMFKETENMLWGPEHSDPGAAPKVAMPAPTTPTSGPRPSGPSSAPSEVPGMAASSSQPMGATGAHPAQPPFDGSAQFVPPAIAESQAALGDTETRRAIRWVQWLQAQGARARSADVTRSRPTGSLDALFGAPHQAPPMGAPGAGSPWPFGGRANQLPVTSLPSTGPTVSPPSSAPSAPLSAPSGALGASAPSAPLPPLPPLARPAEPSGPLPGQMPPPRPEELRQMFAGLEPAAPPSQPLAGVSPSAPEAPARDLEPERPDYSGFAAFADAPASPSAQADWPAALADAFEWPSQPGASAPGAASHANSADVTLEALEGAHSAEGYQPFTLEPGKLAAFSGQPGVEPAGEAARALNDFFQTPEQPPLPPTPPAEPERPAISPTDYPARLEQARALRETGALDEALVEYQALLKNAPDLLPDVLNDLEAALDEQPEHPELHRLLGDARIRQGDYMAALESLNRSVSLNQNTDDE
ncbi:MAG TPA: tetratricopeptide repeat protein [Ktedonobacterales bacterium]